NGNTDTPLPPDEPAGRNPPDGAMLDYYLARPAAGPVVVEIRDRSGALVRRFASDDRPEPPDTAVNIPLSWIRPSPALATERGIHRFVWDLDGAPPPALQHEDPISAIPGAPPREPRGPGGRQRAGPGRDARLGGRPRRAARVRGGPARAAPGSGRSRRGQSDASER